MSKKIYDILPPSLVYKAENSAKDIKTEKKRIRKKDSNKHRRENVFPLKEISVGGLVIVLLLGVYFYNKLPKADIKISPKLDSLVLQEKLTADKTADYISLSEKIIPAQYIEQMEDGRQSFPATGTTSNNSKATGTIKIYNKISPSTPFTLKTGTHFLSDSGKYFITLEKITIPAAKGKTPGSIEVKVQAEDAGADYNIKPSKFSTPKLYGTAYYYGIWAESSKAMSGGYMGTLKKVTKDDIFKAKNELTKKLLIQAENSLKNKLSPDDIFLDGSISREIVDDSSDVKSDSVADQFIESAKVKVSALVFKKQDLEKFIKDDILSQLSEDKKLLENSLDLTYDPDSIDLTGGKEKINLKISANTYYDIDNNNLVDLIIRKSSGEIKEIIDEKYGDKISQLEIHFWPFWVSKAPKNKNRIKINLNFDQK